MQPLCARCLPGRTERDVERQQVLVGGMVFGREGRAVAVAEQVAKPPLQQGTIHPIGEGGDPVGLGRVRRLAEEFLEVMSEAAAADDQHALLPQRRQRAAEVEVVRRAKMRLNRDLQHWDVGLGIHLRQRDPGTVVEAAAVVGTRGKTSSRQ